MALQPRAGAILDAPPLPLPCGYQPRPEEVEALITRARDHALGEELLVRGPIDAIAATFGVHAFVVEHARERLA